MPNTPLQTFRSVEPANYAFGSSATLASRPFVLYHQRGTELTTTGASQTLTYPSFTGSALATRFQPWEVRNQDNHYPVKVPNAYDRVLVFPMYVIDTTNGATGNTGATTPVSVTYSIAVNTSTAYSAPFVMPFGLLPESNLNSRTRNVVHSQEPWDLIRNINPNAVIAPNPETTGCWLALPPYSSNFTTSNGLATAAGTFAAPTSTPRTSTGSSSGIGTSYQFAPDFSVGLKASTTANANNQASFDTTDNSTVFSGSGIEFSTMGCEEIVVSLIKSPANTPAVTINSMSVSGSGAAHGKAAMNFFLVGVFLG